MRALIWFPWFRDFSANLAIVSAGPRHSSICGPSLWWCDHFFRWLTAGLANISWRRHKVRVLSHIILTLMHPLIDIFLPRRQRWELIGISHMVMMNCSWTLFIDDNWRQILTLIRLNICTGCGQELHLNKILTFIDLCFIIFIYFLCAIRNFIIVVYQKLWIDRLLCCDSAFL